jgi:hypothetical protein
VIGMYINRYYFENGRYSDSTWSTINGFSPPPD